LAKHPDDQLEEVIRPLYLIEAAVEGCEFRAEDREVDPETLHEIGVLVFKVREKLASLRDQLAADTGD
jgi:hypothetical protein